MAKIPKRKSKTNDDADKLAAPKVGKWPADQVERRPITELLAYPQNPMTHDDVQIAAIVASMREWGWTIPILVDEKGVIIAGHGRLAAAQKLGLAEVPVMTAKGWTAAQKRSYRIADNQLSRRGEWSPELLKIELKALQTSDYPLQLLGFEDLQLVTFMAGSPDFQPGTEDQQGRLDQLAPMPVECPECGHKFDGRKHVEK